MSLVTEYGRLDRAAITARAREIYYAGNGVTWADARRQAHREASAELRDYFRPQPILEAARA